MPVQPGSPRWTELVQAGIIKNGQRNWFLGDAALEIAPANRNGGDRKSDQMELVPTDSLRQYADEIGVEYASLLKYRQVAAAWPRESRLPGTAWKVHQMLASRQNLIQPGMTVTQAHTALGQKTTGRTGPESDAVAKAAVIGDYLSDPAVAAAAAADMLGALTSTPEGAKRAFKAARESIVRHDQEAIGQPPPKPKPKKEDQFIAMAEVVSELCGKLVTVLEPDLDDPLALSLQFVIDNLDGVSDYSRKRLARVLKEVSARASEWEDRVLGISGHMVEKPPVS